ncbi:pro-cathepsin H-like [Branchiostoma floridae x Branchiostoma japonicum]
MACLFLLAVVGFSAILDLSTSVPVASRDDFHLWVKENGKTYQDEKEFERRFEIFLQSAEEVAAHNAGGHSYELELNKFADMTFEEFRDAYLMTTPQNCSATGEKKARVQSRAGPVPGKKDWRDKPGVVSGVKDQGHCGSCWTFSATGCLESVTAIAFGAPMNLSEQQLVSCAQGFNNHGCEGGLPSQAWEYVKWAQGIESEKDYPYTAKDGKCMFNTNKTIAYVRDVVNITQGDEDEILKAVGTLNPVSIAYEVVAGFKLYKKGVYSSKLCRRDQEHVNHAVLVVGYGEDESGVPYWIVKNSWGPSWGMDGYFLIERNQNMCGLAECAAYPLPPDDK